MTPNDLVNYLELKAIESADIPHDPENGQESFFVIDNPYDLEEFENAVRSAAKFPVMMVEQNDGLLSDNNATNYTNTLKSTILIIDLKSSDDSIRDVKNRCFEIGLRLLASIKKGYKQKEYPGKNTNFYIRSVYIPIGPINTDCFGYQFEIEFTSSFNFS